MNRLLLVACSLAVVLLACPKSTSVTTLAGTDDERMDAISAQLEEFHTRADLKCPDWCSLRPRVCDLSRSACEISGRLPDRADFQKRCLATSEECARFSDGCSACPR